MAKSKTIKNEDIWQKDKLGIKQHVTSFANILKQEKYVENGTSKVYSISAEFGVGKTFFCERLADILEQDGVPVSMLNIWKMDFYDNPLIPLLIKLQDVYIKNNKFRIWLSNRLKFSINITTWLFKRFLKYFGFNIDKIVRLYKQLKPSKSKLYNSYLEYEAQLHKTKNFLSAWAKRINKPIIIIIDELDRCRPDYAVKTLETLKHFFDIPGFVFVLAIDEDQLKSSVETLYGTKNFDGYKRKFINNSFILPAPNKVNFTHFLYEKTGFKTIAQQFEDREQDLIFKIRRDSYQDYINRHFFGVNNESECKKCAEFNQLQTTESIIKRYFSAYSTWFKFTLRQMEQAFDRLVLFSKSFLQNDILYSPDLAVFLVCLHEFDLEIYRKLKNKGSISSSEHLYSTILGNNTSIAYKLYNKDAYERCEKHIDRTLVPECPLIPHYSTYDNAQNPRKIILDNVERFFIQETDNPLKWLRDATIDKNTNPIDNKCRIGCVIHSNNEPQWNTPIPNTDTESNFDLMKFRQNYFDRMDFIANII